ncbi:MAG: beta-galactosidase [Verrucomicrobia bacterium]|nr:beta-galactosidase [Verrucomicrobiota bacterium]
MNPSWKAITALTIRVTIVLLTLTLSGCAISSSRQRSAPAATVALCTFDEGFDVASLETVDATSRLVKHRGSQAVLIETGHQEDWPCIIMIPPGGHWDVGQAATIKMDVTNIGTEIAPVGFRLDNPGGNGTRNSVQTIQGIRPGRTRTLVVDLGTFGARVDPPVKLAGMMRAPGEHTVDPTNITKLIVFADKPTGPHQLVIDHIRAEGQIQVIPQPAFFPFIDDYGQYRHRDWPDKIQTASDFEARARSEADDLAAHRAPTDRNAFGGWTAGPRFEATGRFRTAKVDDQWWLIDPEGYLFWSYGINCVNRGNSTPVTDREHYFSNLEFLTNTFADCWQAASWAPFGFYHNTTYHAFDFTQANLQRKYGPEWESRCADLAHIRLKSWGLNTIANWSDRRIYARQQTPYVGTVYTGGPDLSAATGHWKKFPDVFDPAFAESISRNLNAKATEAHDPWCIGFFVDNEVSWGDDEVAVALFTLACPATQVAKHRFLEALKHKYGTVNHLNAAWHTQHATWDAFLQATNSPDVAVAKADLEAFSALTYETYFRTIREAITAIDPDLLYLGARFAWGNDLVFRIGAHYCDVVSYNKYAYTVADLDIPPDADDKPIIIGEFHFGATDRGKFHWSLKRACDQADRADHLQAYLTGALQNPKIVGAHWFLYRDQASTGRGDGENYQGGFTDMCDTPYWETIAASRRVAESLYADRIDARPNGHVTAR